MAVEIERKFLVVSDGWKADVASRHRLLDGIAPFGAGKVRIRIDECRAWVTFKGPRTGIARPEFEYAVPHHEAQEMLDSLCPSILIRKTRHFVRRSGTIWAVDVHERPFPGLTTAEVELQCAQQPIDLPPWVGEEVTGLTRSSIFQLASCRAEDSAFRGPVQARGGAVGWANTA
jgi:adenylate cyclase